VRVSFGAQPFDQGRYLPESGAIFGLGFVYLVGWPRLRREGVLFPGQEHHDRCRVARGLRLRSGLVDCEELSNRQSPASTSSGAETKASKNPTGEERAAKKPPFKPFKSLKALRAPENDTNPEILAQEVVEDLEAALEQFREAPGILLPTCLQRKNSTCAIDFGIALNQYITSSTFPADRYASLPFRCL
jgi:hypothetical protein